MTTSMTTSMKQLNGTGFIAIRRDLLKNTILHSEKIGPELAYIYLLAHAAYQNGHEGEYKRGECLLSAAELSRLFGWNKSQKVYFIRWLQHNQLAIFHKSGSQSHIILLRYEKDTLSRTTQTDKAPKHPSPCPTQPEESLPARPFEEIRDLYQRLTRSKATDMVRTLRLWNTLSAKQQTVAVRNLPAYLREVKDLRYAKRLYNYLADETYILSNEDFLFTHPLPRHETEE